MTRLTQCMRGQDTTIEALHHLIVTSYTYGSQKCSSSKLFFLRRRHPAAVAMASIATTLLMGKDALETMGHEERKRLLVDTAERQAPLFHFSVHIAGGQDLLLTQCVHACAGSASKPRRTLTARTAR